MPQDLFSKNTKAAAPLADRMRPETLDEFAGQQHLIAPGKLLRSALEGDQVPSMIFWGPPGCGKTTLARIVANTTQSVFVQMSAVSAGVKELREVVRVAQDTSSSTPAGRFCLLTKFTAGANRSKTDYCPILKTAPLP